MSDTKNSKLVPAGSKQIVPRSSSLAKRGVSLANEILYHPKITQDADTPWENLPETILIPYSDAEKLLLNIPIENSTENLTANEWFSKGYEAGTFKDYDKVIDYCTKAIALEPDYAYAYYNRGRAYGMKGNTEKEKEDLKRGADLGGL